MKQKILSILFILLIPFAGFPQNKVSITVAADGSSRDNAISSALYSAIEQSYNSFVSSSTAVLKNKAIVAEMTKQGVIRQKIIEYYKEICVVSISDDKWYALLNATVNLNELVAFLSTKGITASVNMGTFDAKVRKYRFDKIAEKEVIKNTICQILVMPNLYDYRLKLEEPKLTYNDSEYKIEGKVYATTNENTYKAFTMLQKAVLSVGIMAPQEDEIKSYNLTPYFGPYGETIYLRNAPNDYKDTLLYYYPRRGYSPFKEYFVDKKMKVDNPGESQDQFYGCFRNVFWIPAYRGYQVVDSKLGKTNRIQDHRESVLHSNGFPSHYFDFINGLRDQNFEFSVLMYIPVEEASNYSNFIVTPKSYKLTDVVKNSFW